MSEHERVGRRRSTGNKPGPRPKGPRYSRTIRFPLDVNSELVKSAAMAGYKDVNAYVVDIVIKARQAGEWPAVVPGQAQESLPISA
jgi:hypothetical protein